MAELRQSTAATIMLGAFISDSDFKSPQTGLSLVQADFQLSKNGAAAAQKNDTGGGTHRNQGHYSADLNTTDTNTLGRIRVMVNKSTALPVWRDFDVIAQGAWDAKYSTGIASANVTQWNGTNVATPATAGIPKVAIEAAGDFAQAAADKAWSTTTRTLTAFGFSVTVGTNGDKTGYTLSSAGIQAIWDALTSALTTVGSIGKRLADFITGDAFVRLGAPAGASVSADIAAVKTDTSGINTKLGTPAGASVSADIAAIQTKLGTPAGASVSADIAALPTATANADALLKRDMSAVSGEAARSPLNALRLLRNKRSTTETAGQLTVKKEDDTTTAWTAALTTDAASVPVVTVDP